MQWFRSILLLFLVLSGGCATRAPVSPGPSAPSVSPPAGAAARPPAHLPTLASEQQRLSALFDGTPVVFAMQGDGSLRVEVPLRFSFAPGSSTVKPPLCNTVKPPCTRGGIGFSRAPCRICT